MSFAQYISDGFLQTTESRKRLFGKPEVRLIGILANTITVTAVGLGLSQSGREWIEPSLSPYVAPGFDLSTVLSNRAQDIEAMLAEADATDPAFALWLVADRSAMGVLNPNPSWIEAWAERPTTGGEIGIAFFDAYALGEAHPLLAEVTVNDWLEGVANAWPAAVESGLNVPPTPPAAYLPEWTAICESVLSAYEEGLQPDFESHAWIPLVDIWRFEIGRLALVAAGATRWRESSDTERFRGILL